MSDQEKAVAASVARELAECLEEAQGYLDLDDPLHHLITLALDDYKNATWEPAKS
jgi:hypothetical protein